METVASVRKRIEEAKAALMELQTEGPLGPDSTALSVDVFAHLDRAWLDCRRMQNAKNLGR